MLRVIYTSYDQEFEGGEKILVIDDTELPYFPSILCTKLFLEGFIRQWKMKNKHDYVFVKFFYEVTENEDNQESPTEQEILKTLSILRNGGLKQYGFDEDICPICQRRMPEKTKSNHHLIPVVKGGKKGKTVTIHQICHDKIHSVFTEGELAKHYNKIDKLVEHEEIVKFRTWVYKKPNDYNDPSKRAKVRKDKKYESDLS